MVNKYLKYILFGTILVVLLIVFNIQPKDHTKKVTSTTYNTPSSAPSLDLDITAKFRIITNGTTRIFSDKKYHNQSEDVYISSAEPSIVYVKKEGITWRDFFATLPMKLETDCLTTGTGQVFCTNNNQRLYFYINNVENPNALDETITSNDFLLVEYK